MAVQSVAAASCFTLPEFLWRLRVAQHVGAKIYDMHSNTVLHFALAQIMQLSRPLPVLHQVIGDALRKQDMTGIAAIHYPLRHVNTGAGDVGAAVDVDDFTDRPAMNPHAHQNLWMMHFERLRNFQGASRRLL